VSQNCWRVSCPQHAHASAKIQLSAICDKDWQSRLKVTTACRRLLPRIVGVGDGLDVAGPLGGAGGAPADFLAAVCWCGRLWGGLRPGGANPGRLAGRGLSLVCSAWRQGHFQTQAGDLFEAGVGVHE